VRFLRAAQDGKVAFSLVVDAVLHLPGSSFHNDGELRPKDNVIYTPPVTSPDENALSAPMSMQRNNLGSGLLLQKIQIGSTE